VPAPANDESVPPVTPTSSAPKVVEASERAKVSREVAPIRSEEGELVTRTVGSLVSILIAGRLAAAAFTFPARSVNLPAATDTVPLAIDDTLGVNVAV